MWSKLHLWQMQPIRDVLLGLAVFAIFWLGQATSVVTVPLLLAILLAYLFEPVIQFAMSRLGMSRQGSVIGIIASMVLIVAVPVGLGVSYGVIQVVSFSTEIYDSANRVNAAFDEAVGTEDEPGPAARLYEARLEREAEKLRQSSTNAAEPDGDAVPAEQDSQSEDGEPAPDEGASTEPEPEEQIVADVVHTLSEQERTDMARMDAIRATLGDDTGSAWVWYFNQLLLSEFPVGDNESTTSSALAAVNDFVSANTETIAKTGAGFAVNTVERVLGFAVTAFSIAFMGFVTAFFFFFLATGWVEFKGFTDKLIPDKHRDRIVDLATKFDGVISGFVRGRITIAFLQSIVFSIGYFVIGVPASFILGPIVAILSIVPYLALVGVPVAIGLMFLAEPSEGFRGAWWWMVAAPTVFYFMGQALDDYVWTPMIQGKSTGLDTPVILFASIAGGAIFGVFGLLIAIPLAACAKILIQEIFWPRFKEWAEGRADDPLPLEEA